MQSRYRPIWALCLTGIVLVTSVRSLSAETKTETLPGVFEKRVPENLKDLREIQKHVHTLIEKTMPCTVGLRIGAAQGSGVIIDKDGHVLTAGHVSGEAGRKAEIILPDGRKLKGITLGGNAGIDSGLVKITDKLDLPYIEMATSSELKKGDWCLALGHPGGFQSGRSPVVRLGRILESSPKLLRTDCMLVGGDSGGPLFNMQGKVIGIHSRIGANITYNIHVPVDTYRETWDRLVASEIWGKDFGVFDFARSGFGYLGVEASAEGKPMRVATVKPDSPADKAGLKIDDVILKLDQASIESFDDLSRLLRDRRPGNRVTLVVRRGDESHSLLVTLGKRPE